MEQETKAELYDFDQDGQCIGNIPFNKNKISFGRGEDCNVILDHASISRHVCILSFIFLQRT